MRIRSALLVPLAVCLPLAAHAADTYLLQSRGAQVPPPAEDPLKERGLKPYPLCTPGSLNPPDLDDRGGGACSSYSSVELPGTLTFPEWMEKMRHQRPLGDAAQLKLLESSMENSCHQDAYA